MRTSDPWHAGSDDSAERERDGRLELLTDDGGEWTAVPEAAADRELLTRWITVEHSALRDLEAWR